MSWTLQSQSILPQTACGYTLQHPDHLSLHSQSQSSLKADPLVLRTEPSIQADSHTLQDHQ